MTNVTNVDEQKTLFCDIDGVLLKHHGSLEKLIKNPPEVLVGVKEILQQWCLKDYKIVLTTGRKKSMRKLTERQLEECGIFYSELIMECNRGDRVVINDRKPDSTKNTAVAVNLDRNKGMEGLEI